MIPSIKLIYRKAKWQVVSNHFYYRLAYDYGIKEDYHHPEGWYSVIRQDGAWYVVAYVGCAWDGATKYPDYLWMMAPSLVHDILHWLIKRGVIAEHYNDVIDLELHHAIVHGKEPIPLLQGGNSEIVRKIRAWIILRGTNTADEKTISASSNDLPIRSVKV